MVRILFSNFALLMVLIPSVVSEDFCEAFVRNNGEISFVLKTDTTKADVVLYNFMIDGIYWSTTVDVSQTKPQTLTLNTTDSKSSPAFSGQYYAAVWMDFKTRWCVLLFAEKLWPKVDTVCNNGGDGTDLANYQKEEVLTLKEFDRQPKIVFDHSLHTPNTQRVVFVGQTSLGQTLTFKPFGFQRSKTQPVIYHFDVDEKHVFWKDLQSFDNFKPNLHLIAMVYQWTPFDQSFSHLLFFRDNWIIRWCLTSVKDTIKQECQNNPNVLVNCTTKAPTPSTPTSEPTEEPSPYPLIVVIVVIIVVIIILIGVIVFLCCFSKSKTDLKSIWRNKKSEVSQKSSVSSTKNQPSVATSVPTSFSSNFGPKK